MGIGEASDQAVAAGFGGAEFALPRPSEKLQHVQIENMMDFPQPMEVSVFKTLLSAILAVAVAGCVTDGPKDVGGKLLTFSEARTIERGDSFVRFVGADAPVVTKTEVWMRDNTVREERLELESTNVLYVEFAPTLFYDSAYIENPDTARGAAEVYCGKVPEAPKVSRNENGMFVYASCTVGARRCLVAVQGLGRETAMDGYGYKAIADFRYCSSSEEKILARFATLRIKD